MQLREVFLCLGMMTLSLFDRVFNVEYNLTNQMKLEEPGQEAMAVKQYILALDEGTTSARALIFDRSCKLISMAQREFPQSYPQPGWVEQDPMELYASQYATMTEAITKCAIDPREIAAIGITNQRETTIVWDRHTGVPVYNAIVWQCRRTAQMCEDLKAQGLEEYIAEATGLKLDAYFSATKLKWILDHVPGARMRAEAGDLLFGTVDTWLIWKLTEGRVHVTDRTNASRTMLYNIHTLTWDERLLQALEIPRQMLPEVLSSSEVYASASILGQQIPIAGIAGDQQAALFGQGCFCPGQANNTYGPGCFLLMNTGTEPCRNDSGLITTIAATAKHEPVQYALEGSVFVGGAVVQWLRDELQFFTSSEESELVAAQVPSSGGVYVVPAFTGLGAPYWDMYARGTIVGLSRGSNRCHITRAALESIAFQTNDVLRAMAASVQAPLTQLKADGGASRNNLLLQFQADISQLEVIRPASSESTAQGAAYLAGLAVGFWSSRQELLSFDTVQTHFSPSLADEVRRAALSGWQRAVACACGWAK